MRAEGDDKSVRYLLILEAALFALTTTLAMVLAVVCLMYGFHTQLSSRVGAEMPTLVTATVTFGVLATLMGLAFWTLLRDRAWRWWAQGVAVLGMGLGSMFLYNLFTA